MTGLSRLDIGTDVPWVTSWSGEEMLGPGPCLTVDGRLALRQADRPGAGRPLYSKNHVRRQRESVRRMLCPMCGRPTGGDERWIQTASLASAGELRARGLQALPEDVEDERLVLNSGAIAPSHRRCAERALERCPHLRSDPAPELRRFPAAWVAFPLMVETRLVQPAHLLFAAPSPAAAAPAVSFLQLCGITPWRAAPDRAGGSPLGIRRSR